MTATSTLQGHALVVTASSIPMHTLYLGSRAGTGFAPRDIEDISHAITAAFESFTMFPAHGVYRGKTLPSLVIKIGAPDTAAIRRVAQSLGRLFVQEAVGMEVGGTYHCITTG